MSPVDRLRRGLRNALLTLLLLQVALAGWILVGRSRGWALSPIRWNGPLLFLAAGTLSITLRALLGGKLRRARIGLGRLLEFSFAISVAALAILDYQALSTEPVLVGVVLAVCLAILTV